MLDEHAMAWQVGVTRSPPLRGMEDEMSKGDTVYYKNGDATIRARVKTLHRDDSVTVTALFYVDDVGHDTGMYIGFDYRMYAGDLTYDPFNS